MCFGLKLQVEGLNNLIFLIGFQLVLSNGSKDVRNVIQWH